MGYRTLDRVIEEFKARGFVERFVGLLLETVEIHAGAR